MTFSGLLNSLRQRKSECFFFVFLLGLISCCLYFYSYFLNWEFGFDSNIFLYMAKLFEYHGKLPYRDLYELNYIGSHLFYYLVAKVFGFSSYSYKLFDLFFMLALGFSTYKLMPHSKPLVRLIVIFAFFALYLGTWPKNNLQRDYLVLLPLAWCYYLVAIKEHANPHVDLSLIGLLIGLTMVIKPNMIFYAPFLYWGYHHYRKISFSKIGFSLVLGLLVLQMFQPLAYKFFLDRYISASSIFIANMATLFLPLFFLLAAPLLRFKEESKRLIYFFLFCSLPTIACIFLMHYLGILADFIELATDYWVLYFRLDTYMDSEATYGKLASRFIISMTQIADYGYILVPGLISLGIKKYYRHRDFFPLLLLVGASYLNVVIMHKFFPYHYFPVIYFCLIGMSCLFEWPKNNDHFTPMYRFSVAFTLGNIVIQLITIFGYTMYHAQLYKWSTDELVTYMQEEMAGHPQAKVQPLGWVMMGAVKTMEVLNLNVPTRFITTNMLYHHVTHPFVQKKQQEFFDEFIKADPEYLLIEPAPSYIYKERSPKELFPQLHLYIEHNYHRVFPEMDVINRTQVWKKN